jgi:hypothetical protein
MNMKAQLRPNVSFALAFDVWDPQPNLGVQDCLFDLVRLQHMALDPGLCSGDPGNGEGTLSGSEEAPIAWRIGKNDENDNADNDGEATKKAKNPPEVMLASGAIVDEHRHLLPGWQRMRRDGTKGIEDHQEWDGQNHVAQCP